MSAHIMPVSVVVPCGAEEIVMQTSSLLYVAGLMHRVQDTEANADGRAIPPPTVCSYVVFCFEATRNGSTKRARILPS